MRTGKFTVERIAQPLRRVERGVAVAQVCRDVGIIEATFHRRERKFGWLGTQELRELRQLG